MSNEKAGGRWVCFVPKRKTLEFFFNSGSNDIIHHDHGHTSCSVATGTEQEAST